MNAKGSWLPAADPIICLVVGILLACPASSQDQPLALEETGTVPFQQTALPIGAPLKCGLDGNILFRVLEGGNPNRLIRVSADGKSVTKLTFDEPELKKMNLQDYALGQRGEILALTGRQESRGGPVEHFLLTFQRDGALQSVRQIHPGIDAVQLAVFPAGEVLVAGTKIENRAARPAGPAAVVLLDHSGRRVKEVLLDDGLERPKPISTKSKPSEKEREQIDQFESAIELTRLALGPDGNAYLHRWGQNPSVFVVSPAGELLRTLRIPAPDKAARLIAIHLWPGRVAAQYVITGEDSRVLKATAAYYLVLDAESGDTVAKYVATTARLQGAFACYSPEAFTFLGASKSGMMELIRAKPR